MISSARMNRALVAPSILSADFSNLRDSLSLVAKSHADWLHLDIMDGRFVPNLTFGPKMVSDLRPHSSLAFDVHLMTEEPDRLIPEFIEAGANWITFHIEASVHAHRLAIMIRQKGARTGIALVPSTSISVIEELLPYVDLVLVMTVNPGFSGQSMIASCLKKVTRLKELRAKMGLNFLISVDGGVNRDTIPTVLASGVDVVVMGSAFFSSNDPSSEVEFAHGWR